MIDLTHGEQTHALLVLAGLVLWVGFVSSAVLWRQGKEIAAMQERLDDVRRWAWDAHEVLFTDAGWGGEPAPRPPDEPATVVSHPADMYARKAALLDRYAHIGQHRQ